MLNVSQILRPLRAAHGLTNRSSPFQISLIPRPASLARSFAAESSSERTKPIIPLEPRPRSRFLRRSFLAVKYTSFLLLSATAGTFALGAAIFIHDAFTYTDKHVERVPVSPLALHPERGGPKHLPVVNALLADEEDEEFRKLNEKPKLVIVGGGWGVKCRAFSIHSLLTTLTKAVSVLQNLSLGDYHVTVVTSETFTTFTPLLPCKLPFGITLLMPG